MLSAVMEWALFPSITDRRRIAVRFGSRRGGGRRARGSLWNSRGDRCGGRRRGWLHSVSVAGDPAACHRCLPERDGLRPVGRRTEDLPIPPWWPGERGADGAGVPCVLGGHSPSLPGERLLRVCLLYTS